MTHPILSALSGRVLRYGCHCHDDVAEGEFCALELASVARGIEPSDDPSEVGYPDLRPLNDSFTSDAERTDALVPVLLALWDWPEWSAERRAAWARRVAERTVREVLPIATWAAAAYAASNAAKAASNAARAAAYAADTAAAAAAASNAAYAAQNAAAGAAAAGAAPLIAACRIWAEEARSEGRSIDVVLANLADLADVHVDDPDRAHITGYAPDSSDPEYGGVTDPGSPWDERCDELLADVRDALPAGWAADWRDNDIAIWWEGAE